MEGTLDMLGHGVYTIREVARYTRLHPARIRSWFRKPGEDREALLCSDYPGMGTVSFYDLIDVQVAGILRDHGVQMSVIRAAYSLLRRDLNMAHPFCYRLIYTDKRSVFAEVAKEVGSNVLYDVVERQQFISEVMHGHLVHVEYDQQYMAKRWLIASGVVIDPKIGFGKPVSIGTGTSTSLLSKQFEANGRNAELVAELYDVTVSRVLEAVNFEESFSGRKAA